MVGLSKPVETHDLAPYGRTSLRTKSRFCSIPIIDVSDPESKHALIRACEDFGFFKVINHGVPTEFISLLESEAVKFFSLPMSEKTKVAGGAADDPFGYGNREIGRNGDVGWVEYLLMNANLDSGSDWFVSGLGKFRRALEDYIIAVRSMACDVLEMMADGLKIQPRNTLSKLVLDQKSDSIFRLNHYPPCPLLEKANTGLIGFGEHTDPQIISVLRSNNTSGLQICLRDGSWISVPPDSSSFFFNVGDSLQVMTNGRFKSVKHRVLANGMKSRVSMVYFGGPPLSERIAPLPCLMKEEESSLYKEFTWFEYKKSAFDSGLADNRLLNFERVVAK